MWSTSELGIVRSLRLFTPWLRECMHARKGERGWDDPLSSLVFPTYNPGASVVTTWLAVTRFLREVGPTWEVLFVCDGCTDGTTERLFALAGAKSPGIRILAHTPNRGKGYAVRRGLAEARGR